MSLLLAALSLGAAPQEHVRVDGEAAVRYLLGCRRENGAFGPPDRPYTDLAWTYPAVHGLLLLGEKIPDPELCLRNGRSAETRTKTWSLHQKARLNALLGGPPPVAAGKAWTLERRDRKNYEEPFAVGAYFDLESLWHMASALAHAGGTFANAAEIEAFVRARQAPGGGFAETRDPGPADAQAHLLPSAHAALVLSLLGREVPRAAEWIRSCQDESGGFRGRPGSDAPEDAPDVWFAHAAVRALKALGSRPRDPEACARWLDGLQNADGGFGDRPGWASRIYATFYAVHALADLTGDARKAIRPKERRAAAAAIPDGLSIFQAHHKSPPGGAEMADQARAMGFHLLGVKSNAPDAPPGSLQAARARATEKGYPLELLDCPEQYDYRLRWLDGQPADHVANFLVPAELSDAQRAALDAADRAGRQGLGWAEFSERVVAPVVALGTLFYPEHDFTMTNAYRVYGEGGFNAVHAAHFNGPDRIRLYPYRERWLGRLPFIADGDAHGDMAKWADRMRDIRTLYIARGHGLADYLEACRSGRTVCVLRSPKPPETLTYYGAPETVAYVKARLGTWAWWK